jgi:hypothetical protein
MISRKTLLLALIPLLSVGLYVTFLGLNIPFLDQWGFVSILMKKYQGTLTFADLFSRHNEHRPLFPRLIWLGLSEMTRYNVKAELWLNLLIALVTFVIFVYYSIRIWKRPGIEVPVLLIPLLSLLVFNLGQRESWLQGFQTVMYLGMACVVTGMFLLAERSGTLSFLSAMILGIVATYSMANGLLYWFVGLAILLLVSPLKANAARIAIWVVCGGICTTLFLMDWSSGTPFSLHYFLTHLLEWVVWILNFLGAPLMTSRYVAWIFGLLSVVLQVLIIRQAAGSGQWRHLVAYFAIIAFILSTALVTSIGRMPMGMPQSTVSRYLTMTTWYWAAILSMFPLLQHRPAYKNLVYLPVAVSLILLSIVGGWRGHVSLYQRMLPAYQAVISGQTLNDTVLPRVYTNSEPGLLDFLRENKLSAWAEIR